MVNRESSIGRMVGGVLYGILVLLAIALLLGIGYYTVLPKIKASYYSAPAAQQQVTPTADTSALDRLNAQLKAMQAQLNAANSRVTALEVPAGQAPQPLTTDTTQDAGSGEPENNSASPAVAPIVIVHQVTTGGQQSVTGSGACAAAAKGARRCGDK